MSLQSKSFGRPSPPQKSSNRRRSRELSQDRDGHFRRAEAVTGTSSQHGFPPAESVARAAFRVYSPRLMPTFYDRFAECAERWPDHIALEMQSHGHLESCTYAELRRMAESVGRWITENGFVRGSRLAILADNDPRWVAAYLGIIAAGCTAVPLDTALHADQVAKLLQDSGTSALFCDVRHAHVSREAMSDLKIGLVLMDPNRMPSSE